MTSCHPCKVSRYTLGVRDWSLLTGSIVISWFHFGTLRHYRHYHPFHRLRVLDRNTVRGNQRSTTTFSCHGLCCIFREFMIQQCAYTPRIQRQFSHPSPSQQQACRASIHLVFLRELCCLSTVSEAFVPSFPPWITSTSVATWCTQFLCYFHRSRLLGCPTGRHRSGDLLAGRVRLLEDKLNIK